jgi:DNA-binding response OmpR family regulator
MSNKILIVDDDDATRESLAMLLAYAGYDVLTASNVPSALKMLTERDPDLLITDIRLDSYNGLQLIAMAPRPIPAIVVTGFADPSLEADARRMGAAYLLKPVATAALRELIARKLANAQGRPVLIDTRAEPRRPLTTPVSVSAGPLAARVLEVSNRGVKLEVDCGAGVELPSSLTLRFVDHDASVRVEVAWKRGKSDNVWLCGAIVAHASEPQWRALLNTL